MGQGRKNWRNNCRNLSKRLQLTSDKYLTDGDHVNMMFAGGVIYWVQYSQLGRATVSSLCQLSPINAFRDNDNVAMITAPWLSSLYPNLILKDCR